MSWAGRTAEPPARLHSQVGVYQNEAVGTSWPIARRLPREAARFTTHFVAGEKNWMAADALTADQLARLIRAAGYSISATEVQLILKRGAPTNADGTIDVANLTAWLAEQVD